MNQGRKFGINFQQFQYYTAAPIHSLIQQCMLGSFSNSNSNLAQEIRRRIRRDESRGEGESLLLLLQQIVLVLIHILSSIYSNTMFACLFAAYLLWNGWTNLANFFLLAPSWSGGGFQCEEFQIWDSVFLDETRSPSGFLGNQKEWRQRFSA